MIEETSGQDLGDSVLQAEEEEGEMSEEDVKQFLLQSMAGKPGVNYLKVELKNVGIFEMQSPDSTQQELLGNLVSFISAMKPAMATESPDSYV